MERIICTNCNTEVKYNNIFKTTGLMDTTITCKCNGIDWWIDDFKKYGTWQQKAKEYVKSWK